MTFDVTTIVEAVFTLIGVIITAIVIPYIKSKTTQQQQEEIKTWIKIAVAAAEQLYIGHGRGAEKKEYVLNWLKERGITFDANTIDAMVEAAVYELTSSEVLAVVPAMEESK